MESFWKYTTSQVNEHWYTKRAYDLGYVRLTWCPGEHGDWFSLGTNVYTPFFQLLTPELGHSVHAAVQRVDLALKH